MRIQEVWSVSAERIRDFYLSQNGVLQKEEGLFSLGSCELGVEPLPPRKVGSFSFPQTRVVFSGPEEETAAIHRRFVLQFISAGG